MADIDVGKVKITYNGDWDKDKDYEELSIVKTDYNVQYISKKDVDASDDIDITNTDYWEPLSGLWVDSYQGVSDSDLTKRRDGSDLKQGDMYYNTTKDVMKIYNDSDDWIEYTASYSKSTVDDITCNRYTTQSDDFDGSIGNTYLCDTSDKAFTCKLPSDPEVGQRVIIVDKKRSFPNNNLTLDRNGKNINGKDEDYVYDNVGKYEVMYIGDDNWEVFQ